MTNELILYTTDDGQSQFVLRTLAEAAVVNAKLITASKRTHRFHRQYYIDDGANIHHTKSNITVTLSALFSSNKDVTRNLGGFSLPKIHLPQRNEVGK